MTNPSTIQNQGRDGRPRTALVLGATAVSYTHLTLPTN